MTELIWKFNGKEIYPNGKPVINNEWKNSNLEKMLKFFSPKIIESIYNEDLLIYYLSTEIFDNTEYFYWNDPKSPYNLGNKNIDFFLEYLKKNKRYLIELDENIKYIKKIFPELYEKVVHGFLNGEHDT